MMIQFHRILCRRKRESVGASHGVSADLGFSEDAASIQFTHLGIIAYC